MNKAGIFLRSGTAVAAAAILLIPVTHSGAQSGNRYQAIAVDNDGGEAWGSAWGYFSPGEASVAALQGCRNEGGTDCRVEVSGVNNCVSLALGSDSAWGTGYGDDDDTADFYALQTCRQYSSGICTIQTNVCWDDS